MDERVIELIRESNTGSKPLVYLPKDLKNTLVLEKTNLIEAQTGQRDIKRDYDFIRQIGSGSFGIVCEYRNKTTKAKRAVKILDLEKLLCISNSEKQIITELTALKSLDHTNIMNLYSIYKNELQIYIVSELFEDGTLESRYKSRKSIHEEEHAEWISQILKALAYCHSFVLAHRDLKPENIMFSGNTLKLIDFGLSGFMEAKKLFKSTVGSPIFMAPEVITKCLYTEKCDLWSLGIVIINTFTG